MASSAAQMQTGTAVTAYDGNIPLYETGEEIYLRSELDTAGQASFTQNPYTILRNDVVQTNGSGVLLDANGAAAAGVTAASVSTVGGALDTAPEWHIFYLVQQTSKPSNQITVHESQILNLVGANSVRDANDWT